MTELPLPELDELEEIIGALGAHARTEVLARVSVGERKLPIYAVALGATDPAAPTFAMIGGVHGLERIGTEVVLTSMRHLAARLAWDRSVQRTLESTRLVFAPLVNPGGMALHRRGNPRGIDPMRNGPWHRESRPTPIVGGHRISPRLPWYAGREEDGMEVETAALVELVETLVLPARSALALDCHSGFGMVDRIWFPYARTDRPLPHLGHVTALKTLLDETLPYHVYRVEPQSLGYRIGGDVWDHLYDVARARHPEHLFLPFTLEMGSWNWVRKNPRQALHRLGSFNPIERHRRHRTLRRHMPLVDFLVQAATNPGGWAPRTPAEVRAWEELARRTWPIA